MHTSFPPADGETSNGVVFLLTIRAPVEPNEAEQQAAEAVAEVETAFRAVAQRLHSSAAFAVVRDPAAVAAVAAARVAEGPAATVSVRLERLERGRPPVALTTLPRLEHYPPSATGHPISADVPALRAANALDGLESKMSAFVEAQNHAFMTVFDAHNFRAAADSHRLLVIAVVKVGVFL